MRVSSANNNFSSIGLISCVSENEQITLNAMIMFKDKCSFKQPLCHLNMIKNFSMVKQEGRLVTYNSPGTAPTLRPREHHRGRGGKAAGAEKGEGR